MAVKFEKKEEGVFVLNVKGYVCPHPQLYTKKALEKMEQGEILELLFDNPSSGESIIAMCEASGDAIFEKSKAADKLMAWKIRKADAVTVD